MTGWPSDAESLDAEQRRLAALRPARWVPPAGPLRVAGCFLAFGHGSHGRGATGDRGWCGAVVLEVPAAHVVADIVMPAAAGERYDRGRLALREGAALASALGRLSIRPDVVLVDASGRDHPRHAGLALHLGARLDLPSVGVTHRPLLAAGSWPVDEAGASSPLWLEGRVVGAWLRTKAGTRPLAIHAAWRTDPSTAVDVVRRCSAGARTPEPLRQAREIARTARARAEREARDG